MDLTIPRIQKKWLRLVSAGRYFAVVVTPPCSTFSRAVWANDEGPYPLRSVHLAAWLSLELQGETGQG